MKLEEIAKEVAKLPEEERASLASRLLHGLESPVYEVPDEEVFRRMREAEEDPSVMISFDELISGLRRGERWVPSQGPSGPERNSGEIPRCFRRVGRRFLCGVLNRNSKGVRKSPVFHFDANGLRRCNLERFTSERIILQREGCKGGLGYLERFASRAD